MIDVRGDFLGRAHGAVTAVLISKWSEKKFGNIASSAWKQQTRLDWVCLWEIMTDAMIPRAS